MVLVCLGTRQSIVATRFVPRLCLGSAIGTKMGGVAQCADQVFYRGPDRDVHDDTWLATVQRR